MIGWAVLVIFVWFLLACSIAVTIGQVLRDRSREASRYEAIQRYRAEKAAEREAAEGRR